MKVVYLFITLIISYYNGKVLVYLHGGTGFESCPMHVINIFVVFFIFIKSDTLYDFHVVYEIHYDNGNSMQCIEFPLKSGPILTGIRCNIDAFNALHRIPVEKGGFFEPVNLT